MVKIVDKTIEELLLFVRRVTIMEEYSMIDGLLQRGSPLIVFLGLMGLILITLLTHNLFTLLFLYTLSIVFAYLSRIRIKDYIIRTWIFIPLFTLIIAIPAIFNVITPGEKLFEVGSNGIYVTREGILYVSIFIIRTAIIIAYVVLLVSTIGWNRIKYILAIMRIPNIVIDILYMTYRYIFLLLYTSYEMLLSLKSRLNFKTGFKDDIEIGSKILGSLFIKTHRRGELLYLSMLSRGYAGPYPDINGDGEKVFDKNQIPYLLLFATMYIIIYLMEVMAGG